MRARRIVAAMTLQRACRRANLVHALVQSATQSHDAGGLYAHSVMGRLVLSAVRSAAAEPTKSKQVSRTELQAAQMIADLQLLASFARQRLQFLHLLNVARGRSLCGRVYTLM
jgi:hypothetical protein